MLLNIRNRGVDDVLIKNLTSTAVQYYHENETWVRNTGTIYSQNSEGYIPYSWNLFPFTIQLRTICNTELHFVSTLKCVDFVIS